jgi:tripartite ATP-independent transporter DctM subunit
MIDPLMVGWIGLIVLFAIVAIGLPIGIAMALVGFAGYAVIAGLPAALAQLQAVPYSSVASYNLTIIPLFIFMGELAFYSGLIRGFYNTAHKWLGHLPGGLAMTTVAGCAAFASICGSGIATASTMTSIAYPEMKRHNYDPRLSLGCIASGGTLGILIPPSNPMVIYAIFSDTSVGQLFMGGFIPGILMALLFMMVIYIWTRISPSAAPAGPSTSWMQKIISIKDVWPVAVLALIIMGGIWGGIITAMEAAGIGAFVAFVIGLALRKINLKIIITSLNATIKTTAMIFVILIGAMIFNYFIVLSGLPNELAAFVGNLALPPIGVLICILIVYLILGALMDEFAMTVLTLPIFLPILSHLGFDLVWFGIIFVIMCQMGMIAPPVGMNVFVVAGMVKDVPTYTVYRGILPFLGAMIVCVALVVAFPQIALFLPHTMIK